MAGLERRGLTKICEVCGAAFETIRRDVKTCSPACKRALQRRAMLERYGRAGQLNVLERRVCVICGEMYEPSSGNQLVCSYGCRLKQRARRVAERKRAARPEPAQRLPLHRAEGICRKLGMSYGEASAEAISSGVTLARYLVARAEEKGISILEEGEHDSA